MYIQRHKGYDDKTCYKGYLGYSRGTTEDTQVKGLPKLLTERLKEGRFTHATMATRDYKGSKDCKGYKVTRSYGFHGRKGIRVTRT